MSRLYLRLCESFTPALTFLRSGLEGFTWRKKGTVKCFRFFFFFFLYNCSHLVLDEGRHRFKILQKKKKKSVHKQEVMMTWSTDLLKNTDNKQSRKKKNSVMWVCWVTDEGGRHDSLLFYTPPSSEKSPMLCSRGLGDTCQNMDRGHTHTHTLTHIF